MPPTTEEFAIDEETSPITVLLSRFLAFGIHQVTEGEDDSQGTYEEVLRLVLTECERGLLRGNEVHAVAAQLSGTPAKRLDVVKFYYSGRQAASRPIKAHGSALLRAGEAGVCEVFGGQGNIEEYFSELREIFNVDGELVHDYLVYYAPLLPLLSRDPSSGKVYSKGLNVMR